MSFFDCVRDALDDIDDPKKRERARLWAEYAQKVWRDQADRYERQGQRGAMVGGLAVSSSVGERTAEFEVARTPSAAAARSSDNSAPGATKCCRMPRRWATWSE